MLNTTKTLKITLQHPDKTSQTVEDKLSEWVETLNQLEGVNCEVTTTQPAVTPPSRHLMALLTFICLVPLVYFIPPLVAKLLQANHFIHVTISVAIIVPIITYLVMPRLVKQMAKR